MTDTNKIQTISIGDLFESYACIEDVHKLCNPEGKVISEVIILPNDINLKVRTHGNKFARIVFLSRHRTKKHLVQIDLHNNTSVTTTTDHVVMRFNDERMFEAAASKDLKVGDRIQVFYNGEEQSSTIARIFQLGKTEEWVYDMEVDDPEHTFYANDILVHNSQFINIQCITDWFKKEYNLPEKIMEWSDADKLKLWEYVEKFVNEDVTPFVQQLLKDECGCEDTSMLRYSLEYLADCGVYQAKKQYAVHKVLSEGPELVDTNKYTGIELKKNTMSAKTKEFLAEIYENILHLNWNEKDFRNYIYQCFEDYKKLSVIDIAQWKGYNTAKKSTGFLQFEKGASGISKACGVYNDLIQHFEIANQYDAISVGDKVQFVYVKPNKFGVDAIAFKGRWPKEFDEHFRIDYAKMFEKSIMMPLKNLMTAMNYQPVDPEQRTLFDVFDF
jgi:hypothetical protein